jgi:hypothetical protein
MAAQGSRVASGRIWNSGDFDHRWPIRKGSQIDVAIRCIAMQTVANGSGGPLVALFAAAATPQDVIARAARTGQSRASALLQEGAD